MLMKKLLLAGIASLMSLAAQAAPITSGTVLTVGDLTFSNFTCTANSVGSAGGSCAGLSVNSFSGTGIEISGGLSAFTGPGGAPSTQDILISYQVTSAATAFSAIGLGFNGTFEGNAFAEVQESAYSDAARTQLLDSGLVRVSPLSQTAFDTLTFSPILTAYVVKDILLQSLPPGGLATISTVTQVFNTPVSVPEPASMAIFGMGLLALGATRRRAAGNKAA
jgi:hypothetical protein